MSDGIETNNSAPVNDAHEPHEPHIEVLKGNPSEDELAALIAVLGTLGGGATEAAPPGSNRWGLPVDKLRYPEFSWQLITLRERVHMRR